jgi:hypothetical protein
MRRTWIQKEYSAFSEKYSTLFQKKFGLTIPFLFENIKTLLLTQSSRKIIHINLQKIFSVNIVQIKTSMDFKKDYYEIPTNWQKCY